MQTKFISRIHLPTKMKDLHAVSVLQIKLMDLFAGRICEAQLSEPFARFVPRIRLQTKSNHSQDSGFVCRLNQIIHSIQGSFADYVKRCNCVIHTQAK